MLNRDHNPARKGGIRCLFAALFLIILFAELGSHAVLHANPSSADEQAISANDDGHHDPCRYLVLCSDSGRRDRQTTTFRHEVTHTGLIDLAPDSDCQVYIEDDVPIPFGAAHSLFRPPSPLFHPPELS